MLHGKLRLIAAVIGVLVCVVVVGGGWLLPLICRHYVNANITVVDFDVAGGRVRWKNVFLWVHVSGGQRETKLSQLFRELYGELPPPDWRGAYGRPYVARFGGFNATGVYDTALGRADGGTWNSIRDRLGTEATKAALAHYLMLLQSERDFEAEDWLEHLWEVIIYRQGRRLPQPQAEDMGGIEEEWRRVSVPGTGDGEEQAAP